MARSTSDNGLDFAAPRIQWPEGKTFAFTIFDDPDFQTVERAGPVYDYLSDLGFRTTKGAWPGDDSLPDAERRVTCADRAYFAWVQKLQERGFEIGWHGTSPRTSLRPETLAGFERFRELFGNWPKTMSQHYDCSENLYWGDDRLTSPSHRFVYNVLTRWKYHSTYYGHVPGHPMYWSDLCRERVTYVRNFVFSNINTLAACPFMPYHDPARPDVNYWYSSSEGHNVDSFTAMLSEPNQDRLEAEGGACIMYTHFAYRFTENGALDRRFHDLMARLSKKNGWFVPVSTLLDYLAAAQGPTTISPELRRALERRWLIHKVRFGNA